MNIRDFIKLCRKPVRCLCRTGFFLLLGLMALSVKAQRNKLPPFRMFQQNNVIFRAEELPMGKPIVLIYFLPDCDHCQLLTKNIVEHIEYFTNASVVMVTYYPPSEVAKFAHRYNLDKYANFYLGTEGSSFFLKKYYHLSKLPFAAIYTKNGDLAQTYNTEDFFSALVNGLKKIR